MTAMDLGIFLQSVWFLLKLLVLFALFGPLIVIAESTSGTLAYLLGAVAVGLAVLLLFQEVDQLVRARIEEELERSPDDHSPE